MLYELAPWTLAHTRRACPRGNIIIITLLISAILISGCASQKSMRRGGIPGSKPYTVGGKTYYPLKSAHGFVEEGMASWYGPGFHGKQTANGETYNQHAMTAAHKILPLGTNVRVTHLGNGRSVLVRVNDRGPFVDDRVIDLSHEAASRLDMMGSGTAKVRVQSIGNVAQVTSSGDVKGAFYVQVGAFGQKANAQKLINVLSKAGKSGRLIFGNNSMWNVQVGPWNDLFTAQKILPALKALYPHAFVVGEGS